MSATRIALLMTIYPASALLVPPIWGVVSDILSARVGLLRIAIATAGLSLLLFLLPLSTSSIAAVMALYCFFRAPLTALADAVSHAALGPESQRFATVRVFGSIGFAACVLLMGAINASKHLDWLVITTCAIYLGGALFTLGLQAQKQGRTRPRVAEALRHLRSPSTLALLLGTACYYAAHAAYDAFFSLHLAALGQTDRFVGLAWMIGVLAEVALMFFAPKAMHYSRHLLVGSSIVATLRWSLLASLRRPLLILASQPLHGVTFGIWYLSLVKEIQRDAPEHLRAAHQSLGMATMGLGMVVGYLAGGSLFAAGGGHLLYRVAATSAGAAILLYFLRSRMTPPRRYTGR